MSDVGTGVEVDRVDGVHDIGVYDKREVSSLGW
jgi:hypothetical protein